jgi:hypothetical protein
MLSRVPVKIPVIRIKMIHNKRNSFAEKLKTTVEVNKEPDKAHGVLI